MKQRVLVPTNRTIFCLSADTDVVARLLGDFCEHFGEELTPDVPVDTLPPRAAPPTRSRGALSCLQTLPAQLHANPT